MADGSGRSPKRVHYVLWLINAVQDWNKPALLKALCTRPKDPDGQDADVLITAELGDREAPRRMSQGIDINDHALARARDAPYSRTEYTPLGALMHEGGHSDHARFTPRSSLHTFDEYFVPIPVKTLGDLDALKVRAESLRAKLALRTTRDDAVLKKITDTYQRDYFTKASPTYFTKYWDEGLSGAPTAAVPAKDPTRTGREVRMHSAKYVGYYEMLIRWNEREGHEHDRHVLLGYSQGGLVGRFVALLDEHVFRLGLVHGVVTVQTPNYGSPVAARATAPALEEIFRSELPKLPLSLIKPFAPKDTKSLITFLIKEQHTLTIDTLDEALERSILEIRARIDAGESVSAASSQEIIDLLVSGRKWLSGLCAKRWGPEFAFIDLSPRRNHAAAHQFHVLRLINELGHGMPHAAVVGCNPSLKALTGTGVMSVLLRGVVRFVGVSLPKLSAQYQDALDESTRIEAGLHQRHIELAALYVGPLKKRFMRRRGVDLALHFMNEDVAAKSHDCVIPSTHQMMAPLPSSSAAVHEDAEAFLGNWINADSNHASGTALSDAPPSCLKHVLDIFALLAQEDHRQDQNKLAVPA